MPTYEGVTQVAIMAKEVNLVRLIRLKLEMNATFFQLTARERECALLACIGYSLKEVATALCVSRRTVETHFVNIKSKLKVNTKHELIKLIFD